VRVLLRGRVIARANAFPTVARRPAGAYITPVPPIPCARGPLRLVLSSRNPRLSRHRRRDRDNIPPGDEPTCAPTASRSPTDLTAERRLRTHRLRLLVRPSPFYTIVARPARPARLTIKIIKRQIAVETTDRSTRAQSSASEREMLPTVAAALLIAAVQVVQVAGAYTPWVSMLLRDDVYLLIVYLHFFIYAFHFFFTFDKSLQSVHYAQ